MSSPERMEQLAEVIARMVEGARVTEAQQQARDERMRDYERWIRESDQWLAEHETRLQEYEGRAWEHERRAWEHERRVREHAARLRELDEEARAHQERQNESMWALTLIQADIVRLDEQSPD